MFRPLYALCRSFPAMSMGIWVIIIFMAFHKRIPSVFGNGSRDSEDVAYDWHHLSAWEWIYIIYSVGAHACACVIFPCRLAWSAWNMTDEVRLAKYEAAEVTRSYTESEATSSIDDKASLMSMSSTHSLPSDAPLSRAATPKAETFEELAESVIHAIILPNYKEDYDTLRETVSVLASHVLAKSSYDLYLAMEERDPDAKTTAAGLIKTFEGSFRKISYTLHPGDIVGECAGKSSNVSWAARQLSHNYTEPEQRANTVITVMDSDTHLSSNYFVLLTKHHRDDPDRQNTLYCVPVIFDRNAQLVNPLVRAADIFWCGAGLSGLYRGSSIMIPTSVYSIAMLLAGEVGGWDTGPESIGEDMHMFLKCYFKTRGQVKTQIIYSPASQSNVSSSTKGVKGHVDNMMARYKQALRHMWGSLDSGYAIRCGIESLFRRNDVRLTGWLSSSLPEDRVPRWVKDSNLTHFTPPNVCEEDGYLPRRNSFSWLKHFLLYHRLYEAHFLPSHLTIALISAIIYSAAVPATVTNPILLWSLSFCGTLRLVGFAGTAFFIYLYETYHKTCVRLREEEMKRVGLYDDMSENFAHRSWKANWTDYVALPINGTLYGSAPAFVAQLCHIFNDRLTYTVSAKPQLKRIAERISQLA